MYFSVRPYRTLLSTKAQTLKREVGLSGTDTQVVSFFVVCSTLLKQQVAGLNIYLHICYSLDNLVRQVWFGYFSG